MAKLALLLLGSIIAIILFTYPDFTANDRFVGLAMLLFASLFVCTWWYVQRQKLVRNLLLFVFAMATFAFGLVPIYDVLCDVTGINGKLDLSVAAATTAGVDKTRTVTIEFVVAQNQEMPWEFKPKHVTMQVHPGELATTAYYAKNLTNRTMVAQAIPSVSPARVGKYFKKTECFCFSSQKLGPGESAYLGLRFYLDPEFPDDVQRVTLAYTLFDISDDSKEWLCQSQNNIIYLT